MRVSWPPSVVLEVIQSLLSNQGQARCKTHCTVSQEDANKALETSSSSRKALDGEVDEISRVESLIREVIETSQDSDATAPSKQQESAEFLDDVVKGAKL